MEDHKMNLEATPDLGIRNLPSDLVDFVVPSETEFGMMLDHPFCFIFGFELHMESDHANAVRRARNTIKSMSALYRKQCKTGDYAGALSCVAKGHRHEFLLELIKRHGVKKLLPGIRECWTGLENPSHHHDLWQDVWSRVEALGALERFSVIHKEDRSVFDALPETVTVHRGWQGDEDDLNWMGNEDGGPWGWSWTLNREQAEWFARRPSAQPATPFVFTATVQKEYILAYFNDRSEAEIVLNPDYLYGLYGHDIRLDYDRLDVTKNAASDVEEALKEDGTPTCASFDQIIQTGSVAQVA